MSDECSHDWVANSALKPIVERMNTEAAKSKRH